MEFRVKRAPRIDAEITRPGRQEHFASRRDYRCAFQWRLRPARFLAERRLHAHGQRTARARHQDRTTGAEHARRAWKQARAQSARRPRSIAATPRPPCACSPDFSPANRFESRLVGDASLSRRPMDRVIAPLRQDGRKHCRRRAERNGAAAHPRRAAAEESITRLPVASAQVKSALLLAGLFAKGKRPCTSRGRAAITPN